jgi:hypothetical protein
VPSGFFKAMTNTAAPGFNKLISPGAFARISARNTGSPKGVARDDQPDAREGQAGRANYGHRGARLTRTSDDTGKHEAACHGV